MILKKIAEWKMEKSPGNKTIPEELQNHRRAKARKPGKRDLRELAKSLGLGTASSKSPAEKSAAKTATKPGPKSSGNDRKGFF